MITWKNIYYIKLLSISNPIPKFFVITIKILVKGFCVCVCERERLERPV